MTYHEDKTDFFKCLALGEWRKADKIANRAHLSNTERAQWVSLRGLTPFGALEECLINLASSSRPVKKARTGRINATYHSLIMYDEYQSCRQDLSKLAASWHQLGFDVKSIDKVGHRAGFYLLERVKQEVEKLSPRVPGWLLDENPTLSPLCPSSESDRHSLLVNIVNGTGDRAEFLWMQDKNPMGDEVSRNPLTTMMSACISYAKMLNELGSIEHLHSPSFSFLDLTVIAVSLNHPQSAQLLEICDTLKGFSCPLSQGRLLLPLTKACLIKPNIAALMERLELTKITDKAFKMSSENQAIKLSSLKYRL